MPMEDSMSVLTTTMKSIDGKDVDLSQHRGTVLLVVNVASECGYTPQYAGLQKLHESFKARGFSVLGFPANDFGAQEPGSNEAIQQFCTKNFGVTFPMFAKVTVKGDDKVALYDALTSAATLEDKGEVKWNFEKFLIGKDGGVAGRFRSKIAPDDPALLAAIEAELAK
jgi:glutathione peroxidase